MTRIRIDGFAHGGRGVGRLDGKVVFVSGALPGELVEVSMGRDGGRWAEADLVRVVEPAPGRVDPPCPWVPDCGGCDLQHAAPDVQRELKTRVVREQLERLGGVANPAVTPCIATGPDTGYRTSVQLHAAGESLGFHRARSHAIVPIDRCLVATDTMNDLLAVLPGPGGAGGVSIRAHDDGLALVVTPGDGPLAVPDVEADVHLTQPDGSTVTLRGEPVLFQTVGGIRYGYGPSDFFQVSEGGADALVATVMAAVGDVSGQLAWDLYAGVGLLSIPLALGGAEVVAVEVGRSAARHAAQNAQAAGVAVVVEQALVQEYLRGQAATRDLPDLVVLDPPRDGAGADVCRFLAALEVPLVVYVACDPASLARDVRTLTDAGYHLDQAQPLDLFPMTHHVEVVATLHR